MQRLFREELLVTRNKEHCSEVENSEKREIGRN